jgi:2-dehydro-3-deoxyphosphogluconate aldolase/(4S)-4-hydroxy-2-oxoglutarate aldolase
MEKIAALFFENGFTTLEVTMNSPGAADMIRKLSTDYEDRLNIGAGTVCTIADLNEALAAGASFIVTPVLVEEVIIAAVERNVPIFPGAYTPSEIYRAWSLGASMIKVFPATKLGPEYIKDVLAPLPQIRLLPTGGVNDGIVHTWNNFKTVIAPFKQ